MKLSGLTYGEGGKGFFVTRKPQMLIARVAAFLENYSAVIAWNLNGSSIECHEKKR